MPSVGHQLCGPPPTPWHLLAPACLQVDNLTSTCASASLASNGFSHLTVYLTAPTAVSGVTIILGSAPYDLQLLAGNDSSLEGTNNPACAGPLAVPAAKWTTLPCSVIATVLTLKSSCAMWVCDFSVAPVDLQRAGNGSAITIGARANCGVGSGSTVSSASANETRQQVADILNVTGQLQ